MLIILSSRQKVLNYHVYRKEKSYLCGSFKGQEYKCTKGQTGSSNLALLFHESLNHRPGRDLEKHLPTLSKETLPIPDNH